MVPHYFLNISDDQLISPTQSNTRHIGVNATTDRKYRLALIDRDGVVIYKSPRHKYHLSTSTIKLIDSAAAAIRQLNQANIPVVLVTNQPGIHKQLFSIEEFINMNKYAQELLSQHNARIDAVFFCPHPAYTEGDLLSQDQEDCSCRKPKPGMLISAMKLFDVSPANTIYFDDFETGIIAAERASVQPVYIATRHDEYEHQYKEILHNHPTIYKHFRFGTLASAVSSVIFRDKIGI